MRLLHVHTRFDPLGEAMGTAMFTRALWAGVEHAVVAAEPIAPEARAAAGAKIAFPDDFPPLGGAPLPRRLHGIGVALREYDLVLTHGWGAIDAVLAATLFGPQLGVPPVIHHEHVRDLAEAGTLLRRRTWTRRIAFGRAAALVVPSGRLEALALGSWQQPATRVRRIAPAADLAALARAPRPDALPRLIKRPGELWLGALGMLDDEAGALRLVRALAALGKAWQLVLPGNGPARDAVRAEARRLAIAHRVHMPGALGEPTQALGLFDLFAHASDREPFPEIVAAAMGAGLAFAALCVGDLAEWLGEAAAQLVAPGDEAAFMALIAALADDFARRRGLGEANRRAAAVFARDTVLGQMRDACAAALGRERFP